MTSRIWKSVFAGIGMLVLILDAKTAMLGGADGLRVCLTTVIPSLLPFFVLSILLTSALSGNQMKLLKPIGRLCKMPPGSEPLLLLGLLGGYPTGAQAVYQSYSTGQLTKTDAQRLLGFCSNAGPSFLFGIAAAAFTEQWMPWILWLNHILSAIITGILLPGKPSSSICLNTKEPMTLPQAIEQAVRIMAKVCAWILLFRVVLVFCDRWFLWLFTREVSSIFTGILELANGCLQLKQIACTGLRFIVCSGILSFGGLSVAMQTLSVTGEFGFGMYLQGKIIQTAVSVLLAYAIQLIACGADRYVLSPVILCFLTAFLLAFLFFLHKTKNYSRNQAKAVV